MMTTTHHRYFLPTNRFKNHKETFSFTFYIGLVLTFTRAVGVEVFRREEVTKALLINGSGKRRC